jgi:hypothetical protein
MKKVYLLFGSIVVLNIADLLFTSLATEKINLYLDIAMILLYVVCLFMVLFHKKATWRWRLTVVGLALLAMTAYFKTNHLRSRGAFYIDFYQHQGKLKKFAMLLDQKADSIFRQKKANGAGYIFNTEINMALDSFPELRKMKEDAGIRFYYLKDAVVGDSTIEGKFIPEFDLVNDNMSFGLYYDPEDLDVEKVPVGVRQVWRHDSDWLFWSEYSGGVAAPM